MAKHSMGPNHARPSSKRKAKISASPARSAGGGKTVPSTHNALAELCKKDGAAKVLTNLRENLSSLEAQHRERLLENSARIYEVATFLREEEDAWLEFCHHSAWVGFRNRPKDTQQSDALRFALRMAVGFGDDPASKRAATKRANKFYGALQPFFSRRVPPWKIVAEIKKGGGFEALKKDNAATRRGEDKPSEKPETLLLRMPLTPESRGLLKERQKQKLGIIFKILTIKGKTINADFYRYSKLKKKTNPPDEAACNTENAAKKLKPPKDTENSPTKQRSTKKPHARNMKGH
ncbi:hypothetical protein ATER59S_01693 [Aquamicrobium terrae]